MIRPNTKKARRRRRRRRKKKEQESAEAFQRTKNLTILKKIGHLLSKIRFSTSF